MNQEPSKEAKMLQFKTPIRTNQTSVPLVQTAALIYNILLRVAFLFRVSLILRLLIYVSNLTFSYSRKMYGDAEYYDAETASLAIKRPDDLAKIDSPKVFY